MVTKLIFVSTLSMLLMFNIFVVMINPTASSILNISYQEVVVQALAIIVSGSLISVVLGETVLKIVFSTIIIFNVLFQVHIYGFTVGLGLVQTVFNVFQVYDVMNLGFYITSIISLVVFFSGMLIIVESV